MELSMYRDLLTDWFTTANKAYFDFKLQPSSIIFGSPSSTKEYVEFSDGKIVIRKSLVTGSHPQIQPGPEYEAGRLLFIKDVILHGMVHQALIELKGIDERNYDGHGPTFRDHCNRIGTTLDLPPVRASKTHPKKRHLISCAFWPSGVRPPGYYVGAFSPVIRRRRKSALHGLVEKIANLDLDDRRELRMILMSKKLI